MTTTVTTFVNPGDNPQTVFDALPNPTAGDTIQKLVFKKGVWRSATGPLVSITRAGSTVSATNYFVVEVEAGGSIYDNTANPLRLDETKGALIEMTGDYNPAVYVTTPYTRISGLQISSTSAGTSGQTALRLEAANCVLDRLLLSSYSISQYYPGAFFGVASPSGASVLSNSTLVQKNSSTAAIIAHIASNFKLHNVTAVSLNATLDNGIVTQYETCELKNVYVGNVTAAVSGPAPTVATCATSAASGPTGFLANIPFSTATFSSVTAGAQDFRLAFGSALINAGTALTDTITDAYGQARTGGTDIGAFEYQAVPVAPVLSVPAASATSATSASGSVATDKAGGLLYYLINGNATATATEVKAGSSKPVTATGTQNVNWTTLTQATDYYAHFVQVDSDTLTSNVVNSAKITTPAVDSVAPVFAGGAVITPGTITSTSVAFSYPAATDNVAVTGYQASKDGGSTWQDNGTGLTGQFSGLPSNTDIPIAVRAYDAQANKSAMLTLTMHTAAAATTGTITWPFPIVPINGDARLSAGHRIAVCNMTTDALVVKKTGLVTHATTGVPPAISDALIVTGTLYRCHLILDSDNTASGTEVITAT